MSDIDFENILHGGGTCTLEFRCSCITNKGTRCKNCVLDGMTTCYIHSKTGCKTTQDFLASVAAAPLMQPFRPPFRRSTTPTYVARRSPSPVAFKYYDGILGANNEYRFRNLPRYKLDASYYKVKPILKVPVPAVAAVVKAVTDPVVAPVKAIVKAVAETSGAASGAAVPGTRFKIGDKVRCAVTENLKAVFTITSYYINPSGKTIVEGIEEGTGKKVTYSPQFCELTEALPLSSTQPVFYQGFVSQASDEEILEGKHDPFHNKFTSQDFKRLAEIVIKYDEVHKILGSIYFNNRFMRLFNVTPKYMDGFYKNILYAKKTFRYSKALLIIEFLLEGYAVEMMSGRNWDLSNVFEDRFMFSERYNEMYGLYSEYWDRVIKPRYLEPQYQRPNPPL
jgi:hypothetical protein